MLDRETVIEGLQKIIKDDGMWKYHYCVAYLLSDAAELLKEQEEKPNGKCANECECWDSAYERGKQDALKEQEAKEQISDAIHETAKQFRQTIVRCNNCKFYEPLGEYCKYDGTVESNKRHPYGIACKPDWFCADGKRRAYVKPVTESATDWDGINCE